MLHRYFIYFFITFSSATYAESLEQYSSGMIQKCVSDGEQTGVCLCAVNQWMKSVKPSQKATAITMAKSMINDKPPTSISMAQLQPLMLSFQQVGMKCATTAYVAEEEAPIDMGQYVPGMSGDQTALLNQMANGGGSGQDVMNMIAQMDAKDQKQRQAAKQKRQEQELKQRQEREKKQKVYQAALNKIEARRPVSSIPYQDMKEAFFLRGEAIGQAKSETSCFWRVLDNIATNDGAGSWLVYDEMAGGRDYDHPEDFRPYQQKTTKLWEQYYSKKQACYR